jgi:4-oxalocrotonate tautomerase
MPVITVAMFSGRSQKEKDRFAEAITEDAVKILRVKREDVILYFRRNLMEIGMHQVLDFEELGGPYVILADFFSL